MPASPRASATTTERLEDAYGRLGPRLVETAYLLTFDRATAQDVVHDVFAAVLPRWSTIEDPDRYLRRAVTLGAYKASRDRRRRTEKHERAGIAAGAHVDRIDLLADQVGRLPAKERAVVVLRFYLDLPIAEIAETLSMRPGSVGPTLTRALRRLEGGMQE